jgi:tRNA threonylcarbamoyladenosine biosynthesis protein TsaB
MAILGLALETSGRNGSVALLADGVVVGGRSFEHGLRNAAMLLPLIAEMLRTAGVAPGDVDELYVSTGPGSFTGLRIAITMAKTWWLTNGTPIVSVPSTRAIAENAPAHAKHAAVVLDAKRGQVFTATYSRNDDGAWTEVLPARVDTLASVIEKGPRPLMLIGEGLAYHAPPEGAPVDLAPKESWPARAEVVGHLGHAAARRTEFTDPMTLTPTYIRLAEAEEKLLG